MAYNRRPARIAGKPVRLNARRAGFCYGCGTPIAVGDPILWQPGVGHAYAENCPEHCAANRQRTLDKAEAERQGALEDEAAHERMYGHLL